MLFNIMHGSSHGDFGIEPPKIEKILSLYLQWTFEVTQYFVINLFLYKNDNNLKQIDNHILRLS